MNGVINSVAREGPVNMHGAHLVKKDVLFVIDCEYLKVIGEVGWAAGNDAVSLHIREPDVAVPVAIPMCRVYPQPMSAAGEHLERMSVMMDADFKKCPEENV
jgi:hypothetical protein